MSDWNKSRRGATGLDRSVITYWAWYFAPSCRSRFSPSSASDLYQRSGGGRPVAKTLLNPPPPHDQFAGILRHVFPVHHVAAASVPGKRLRQPRHEKAGVGWDLARAGDPLARRVPVAKTFQAVRPRRTGARSGPTHEHPDRRPTRGSSTPTPNGARAAQAVAAERKGGIGHDYFHFQHFRFLLPAAGFRPLSSDL